MDWKRLARKHQKSGVLVDTNLLLLLLIGIVDKRKIGGKRTREYTEDHYLVLLDFIKDFRQLITTPHILAEVSNLGKAVFDGEYRERFFRLLGAPNLFDIMSTENIAIERHIRRQEADIRQIQEFGLPDAAIIKLCTSGLFSRPLLLSNDAELVVRVSKLKGEAINFNRILEYKRNL